MGCGASSQGRANETISRGLPKDERPCQDSSVSRTGNDSRRALQWNPQSVSRSESQTVSAALEPLQSQTSAVTTSATFRVASAPPSRNASRAPSASFADSDRPATAGSSARTSSVNGRGVEVAAAADEEAEKRRQRKLDIVSSAHKLRLRHDLLVQGQPLGWSHVVSQYDVDTAAEIEQLLQVWRQDWYGFPQWQYVQMARTALLKSEDASLWGRLTNSERRMAVEMLVWAHPADGKGTLNEPKYVQAFVQLLETCTQRRLQQQMQSEAADTQQGAAELVMTAPQGQSSSQVALFITPATATAFAERHGLQQLGQHGKAPETRVERSGRAHSGVEGPVRGRAHNLTAREVLERIIVPALEATGGMSYVEAFLPAERRLVPRYSTRYETLPVLPHRPGIEVPCPLWMDFVDLAATLKSGAFCAGTRFGKGAIQGDVPLWVDMFCQPQATGGAAAEALPLGPQAATATTRPGSASAASTTPVTKAEPGPAVGEGCRAPPTKPPAVAAAAALAACKYVGVLAGPVWPWLPMQPPPSLADGDCVRQIADVRRRGMATVPLARAFADVVVKRNQDGVGLRDKKDCIPSNKLVEEAVAQLKAGSEANSLPVSALAGGGEAEAAAELWRVYVQDAEMLSKYYNGMCPERTQATLLHDEMSKRHDWGPASLRVTRTLFLEALVPERPAADQASEGPTTAASPPASTKPHAPAGLAASLAAGSCVADGERAEVLLELVMDEVLLHCPPGMPQSEADELFEVWYRDWNGLPRFSTVLRIRAVCGGGGPDSKWALMNSYQKRTAVELAMLYGDEAATWRPSPAAEARDRAVSSRGHFVSAAFLNRFSEVHDIKHDKGKRPPLLTLPSQDAWDPITQIVNMGEASTSWVCSSIVLPATKAYGMCYSDLFLSKEAQAAFLPQGAERFCGNVDDNPNRAFASHAWACPFTEFKDALIQDAGGRGDSDKKKASQSFWIDIFHKNQWQPVGIHDLKDNLTLAGRVEAVVYPFPKPYLTTRVWCLYEWLTALQLSVPLRLCFNSNVESEIKARLIEEMPKTQNNPRVLKLSEELEAEVASLDVSTAQATVPADKDMILDMIREGVGVEEMNRQIRELFRKLLMEILKVENDYYSDMFYMEAQAACFGGDGQVVRQEVGRTGGPCSGGVHSNGVPKGKSVLSRCRHKVCKYQNHRQGAASYSSRTTTYRSGRGRAGSGRLCRVADLRPGDRIRTGGGGVSTVVLVTVDPVGPEGVELCRLPCGGGAGGAGGRLLVTPDHPVLVDGVWRLPRNLAPVERLSAQQVPYGCVFNLELEPPASLDVSGVVLVSLGQDTSRDVRQGVDPASDALYGWGWKQNPHRACYLRSQEERFKLRQEGRWLAGGPERRRL